MVRTMAKIGILYYIHYPLPVNKIQISWWLESKLVFRFYNTLYVLLYNWHSRTSIRVLTQRWYGIPTESPLLYSSFPLCFKYHVLTLYYNCPTSKLHWYTKQEYWRSRSIRSTCSSSNNVFCMWFNCNLNGWTTN